MQLSRRLPVLLFIPLCLIFTLGYASSTAEDINIPLDGIPVCLAINPQTNQALVVSIWPKKVNVVDLNSQTIQAVVPIGNLPTGLVINATLNLAVVANSLGSTLSVINLNTNKVQRTVKVGFGPYSVAVYDGGTAGPHLALVTHFLTNTVSVVDLAQMQEIRTVRVGNGPKDIAVDPLLKLALVANELDHNLSVIDLNTFLETRKVPVGHFPRAIGINPETHLVAVANLWESFISVVDLNNWNTVSIATDRYPLDVAMNPLDNSVLVICSSTQTLHHIELDTNTLIKKYPLKKQSRGVAVNPFTNIAAVVDDQTDSLTLIQLPNPVPEILSISPNSIPRGSLGTKLTIEGSGFIKTSTISFQPSINTTLPVTFVDNHHLEVNLPSTLFNQAGTFQITVNNPAPEGGSSNTLVLAVINPVPAITAINPASTQAGGSGLTLTIYGTGFFPGTSVFVNGQTESTTYVSGTELKINLDASHLATGGTLSITASPFCNKPKFNKSRQFGFYFEPGREQFCHQLFGQVQ